MDKTNSATRQHDFSEKSFAGGMNSNPEFYTAVSSVEGNLRSPGQDFVMNHTPIGIAVKSAVGYAKSPEFQEKVEFGKEKLSAGVARARSMIDDIRGAIPQGVKDAAVRTAEAVSPAIAPLRRGLSEVFSPNHDVRVNKDGTQYGR